MNNIIKNPIFLFILTILFSKIQSKTDEIFLECLKDIKNDQNVILNSKQLQSQEFQEDEDCEFINNITETQSSTEPWNAQKTLKIIQCFDKIIEKQEEEFPAQKAYFQQVQTCAYPSKKIEPEIYTELYESQEENEKNVGIFMKQSKKLLQCLKKIDRSVCNDLCLVKSEITVQYMFRTEKSCIQLKKSGALSQNTWSEETIETYNECMDRIIEKQTGGAKQIQQQIKQCAPSNQANSSFNFGKTTLLMIFTIALILF